MTTWNAPTNLTPVSACAADGSVLRRCWWDFSIPAMLGTDFTQHGTDKGTIAFTDGALRIDATAQMSSMLNGDPTGSTYVEVAGDLADADFDYSCVVAGYDLRANSSAVMLGVRLHVGGFNYYGGILYEPWGESRIVVSWAGSGLVHTQVVGLMSSIQFRIVRDKAAGDYSFYYRASSGDAWAHVYTQSSTSAGTRAFLALSSLSASPEGEYVAFDNLRFVTGAPLPAVLQVHDLGLAYCDAGPGDAFDNSLALTDQNDALVEHRFADSDTPAFGAYNDWQVVEGGLTLSPPTGLRYRQQQLRLAGGVTQIAWLETPPYDVDVTPPADPAARRFVTFETDKVALDWTEPADADFARCHLRRVADGVDAFLATDGSWLPLVLYGTGGSALSFAAGVSAGGTVPFSGFVDDTGASEPVYYVRALDTAGNASAWMPFAAGSLLLAYPAAPALAVTDNEDGLTATAVVSGADPDTTNVLLTRPRGGSAWTETASVAGNDQATLTLPTGAYWVAVRSVRGDLATLGAVEGVWITTGDAHLGEIRTALRALLAEDSVLGALLADPEPVRPAHPDASAALPALTYAIVWAPDAAVDAPGVLDVRLTLRAAAESTETLDKIAGAAARVLETARPTTPHWTLRRPRATGMEDDAAGWRAPSGAPVRLRTIGFAFRAFRRGA